jgi:hypothetical protein
MMTIQQTIAIPADRRLHLDFDLPENLPEGQADITLIVKPKGEGRKIPFFRRASIMDFYGCLKDSPAFAEDGVEYQRKIRDEWPD